MHRHRRPIPILVLLTAAALLAGLAALSGCGKTASPVATSIAPASASQGSPGAAALEAIAATMQAGDTLVHGPCVGFGFPLMIPRGCPYDSVTGTHTCGPETEFDGFTVMRGYQFLDAADNPQEFYDSLTTATIKYSSTVSGTMDWDHRWSQVDDSRELTESGLAGQETTRIFDGTATMSHRDSVSTSDSTRVLRSSTASTTVASVVVPAPFLRDSWPLSGTITTHLTNSDGLDLTSVLTFNGTQYATLAVGDSTYTVDLAGHRLRGEGDHHGGDDDGPMHR